MLLYTVGNRATYDLWLTQGVFKGVGGSVWLSVAAVTAYYTQVCKGVVQLGGEDVPAAVYVLDAGDASLEELLSDYDPRDVLGFFSLLRALPVIACLSLKPVG